MSATASIIFFPADWRAEPGLRQCSMSARGVWMEMLCLAVDAIEPGFVMVGPKPVTMSSGAMLARDIGCDSAEAQAALDELKSWDVFSIDARGWIYCRRMMRGKKLAQRASSGGRAAASANPRDDKGKFKQAGEKLQHTTSSSTSTSPESKKEEEESGGGAVPVQPRLELELQDVEEPKALQRRQAVELYNRVAAALGWVACKDITATRVTGLDARLGALGLRGWADMLEHASGLKFFDCTVEREGKHAHWRPALDFFLSETKAAKVREGAYDRYGKSTAESLHSLTGGARLAALVSLGSLDG